MVNQITDRISQMPSPWPARTGVSRTELNPVSFLHRSVAIHPDRVAVVHSERRYTYAELSERVNRLASALRAHGLEPTTALRRCVRTSRPCSSCTTACRRPVASWSRSTPG